MTCSGLEVALFRAHLTANNKSEHTWWGGKSNAITTDITIPFTPDIKMLRPWLKRAAGAGFTMYKVKVSGRLKADLAFIRSVWDFLTDAAHPLPLRLDGNQAFTPDSAMRLLDRLALLSIPVELFEQPLKAHDHKGAAQLYKKIPVPLIADETVFTEADCRRVIDDRLAHGVNIKIAKSGITESRKILNAARRAKLKLMLGCMTETFTGMSAGIYAAAGSGTFDYIDLDAVHFLRRAGQTHDIIIDGPYYRIGGPR
jgi:L-alanine-DL-glutamate epimerase-like enolase superfamily enzyme